MDQQRNAESSNELNKQLFIKYHSLVCNAIHSIMFD